MSDVLPGCYEETHAVEFKPRAQTSLVRMVVDLLSTCATSPQPVQNKSIAVRHILCQLRTLYSFEKVT